MIDYPANGDTYSGYLAPSTNGKGPGVIVIQEWWGLVGHIKDVADRFALAGFTALAPDLYKGEIAEEPDTAGKMMMALNIEEAEKVLRGAVNRLLEDPATEGNKVGVVGFCMGGQLALLAATTNDNIGACVNFYGIHPHVKPDFSQLKGPVLGIFAENDAYTSPEVVNALSEELKKIGKEHDFTIYPGTDHAFFNDDRPEVFHEEASRDAWDRMIKFFRVNL